MPMFVVNDGTVLRVKQSYDKQQCHLYLTRWHHTKLLPFPANLCQFIEQQACNSKGNFVKATQIWRRNFSMRMLGNGMPFIFAKYLRMLTMCGGMQCALRWFEKLPGFNLSLCTLNTDINIYIYICVCVCIHI